VVVGEVLDADGTRAVEFVGDELPDELVAAIGDVPLPPYIHERLADPDRYQTVYARTPGSVAAPTAGLHLTEDVLARCRAAGAEIATVTLDVGLGTFRPIATERVEDHHMHAETYVLPDATVAALGRARRVIAVGTTSLRCLESWAASGQRRGATELFIHGDYPFKVVDVLLTNFHLPGSSLLALLDAFTGPRWRDLYALALREGYRFLSFGDAMLVDRRGA
jgi:S-adenosylmethionine:tRNA ribosyltransferase-isomerase